MNRFISSWKRTAASATNLAGESSGARTLPLSLGTIHFVGIGGIGMSGIAEVLHVQGYKVQGSDIAVNGNIERLKNQGIQISIGHDPENVANAELLVVSTAVRADNAEVREARARHIPIIRRAEMLAELMRLKWAIAVGGTHGKTTTTSLIGAILEEAGIDPTVINGGIIESYGTNTRVGKGDWLVAEADESDGSFLRLPAVIAVITNMDPEHLDHWGSCEAMEQAYADFIGNTPFYGFSALCMEHPRVRALAESVTDRRILTYGFHPQADLQADNVEMDETGTHFEVRIFRKTDEETRTTRRFFLPVLGTHNLLNALAAITIATEMDIDENTIARALEKFRGVKRRFTHVGGWNGAKFIDDYAHHPVEIQAVVSAARQAGAKRVITVVQPHRYSRLSRLFGEFRDCLLPADMIILADVYPAGESPIEGADKEALGTALQEAGHQHVYLLERPEALPALIKKHVRKGDYVLCLGAGSISQWANRLEAGIREAAPA